MGKPTTTTDRQIMRSSNHKGKTSRRQHDSIGILLDAELRDIDLCTKLHLLACRCCSVYDHERSYLYLRENSIESNVAYSPCFGMFADCQSTDCYDRDDVRVYYFDRAPFRPG